MLLVESGISPEVVRERGYKTARRRSQLRRLFPEWQRRAPSLFIPVYSPDEVTESAQIRPVTPRKGKNGKVQKYENASGSQCILDVHPRNRDALADTARPLFVVEGVKKGDALTSRGEVAISIVGVWNWTRGGKPLPCWEHVALDGRVVYVAFDSDVLLKPEVQLALERLCAFLAERGASPRVVYLPGGEGENKIGVDDFLAGGGTVRDLRRLAKPYVPADVTRLRLQRAPGLRERIEELRQIARNMPTHKQADFTRRSVFNAHIDLAERYGEVHPEGVRVAAPVRTAAELAAVSKSRVPPALDALEVEHYLRRDYKGREQEKAGAVVLFTPRAKTGHQGSKSRKSKSFTPGGEGRANAGHMEGGESDAQRFLGETPPYVPHLRGAGAGDEAVPEMRWSTNVRSRGVDRYTGEMHYVYEHLRRVGKKSARVVEYLAETGATATVAELAEMFGTEAERKRPRDFRRRHIDKTLLDPAIVVLVGGGLVGLSPEWRQMLEEARKLGREPEAAKHQREDHELQRRRFKERNKVKADPEPEIPPAENMAQPWAYHPEGCACRACSEKFGPVVGDLGEHVERCKCAMCFSIERGRALPTGGAYVWVEADAASASLQVVRPIGLERPEEPEPEPSVEDHPLACECMDCSYSERRYARPKARG